MDLKKRAIALVATVGFLGGVLGLSVPAAHATVLGSCSGMQLVGSFVPALPSGGGTTSTVLTLKTAKAGTVAWGVGFNFAETATTGFATCVIDGITYNDVTVTAKLNGTTSCDPALIFPAVYPLNGKMTITYAGGTSRIKMFVRVVGFDPVPGPDVQALTGTVAPSSTTDGGATVGGEFFFDPIIKAAVNDDPSALAQGALPGQVFKNQYFFDNTQISNPCGAGGAPISLTWGGDGTSPIGSEAQGISWEI